VTDSTENSADFVGRKALDVRSALRVPERACWMVAGLGFWLLGACGSNKNHEQRALVAGPEPAYCIGLCEPDTGSAPVDCTGPLQGLEFLRIWDFETPEGAPTADSLYFYDDYTALTVPFFYNPPASPITRCGTGNEHGFHAYGGPYTGWGGGLGRRVDGIAAANCNTDPRPDFCPGPDAEFPSMTLNLSEWEGVSFWARRGPDGAPGVRVVVGDHNTDDDISFRMLKRDPSEPRFCERNRECGCRSERRPCSYYDDPDGVLSGYFCWDPAVDPVPSAMTDICDPLLESCMDPLPPPPGPYDSRGGIRTQYRTCGETKCAEDYPAFSGEEDPQFHTDTPSGRVPKPCTPFTFRGGIRDDYCFDPAKDADPYEAPLTCGDHWMAGVTLTTDWQFFKVPFTELLQQGWAKEFPALLVDKITIVRFTWDKGWLDLWLDDVSFYRRARN
jgi:hypothetical protein